MKFRTEYKPEKAGFTLNPGHHVLMLGSCFADNIRQKMRECLWRAENHLGTLYNPLSIERAIRICMEQTPHPADFSTSTFKSSEGIWHSWLFDSKLSSPSEEILIDKFRHTGHKFMSDLKDTQALFVTFGTSHCYFLAGHPGYVVANCHKQPAALFVRRRLSVDEIVGTWSRLADDLLAFNPTLRIVFTVSPVRHIKDGLTGNARSKAVLLLAIDELCSRLPQCSYFPAYEIVNDDLRDYRFYASDLVHPSDQAVEYLWEIFRQTYLDSDGERLLKEGNGILKAISHRPLIDICGDDTDRQRTLRRRCDDFIASHPDMLHV